MILAAALLLGAGLIAWWAPRPLHRLALSRLDPRAAIACWLLSVAGVLASAAAGATLLIVPGHGPAPAVLRALHGCWSTVDHHGFPSLDPATGALTAVTVGVAGVRVVALWVGRSRCRRRLHRGHLDVLRIAGSKPLGAVPTLWVDHDRPLAYSLGGRHALVVASYGLAGKLSSDELRAVLAHEHAHLRGHHHLLTGCAAVVGAALRVVPLMRELPVAIRILVELAADRAAARECGTGAVRSALVTVAPVAVPLPALGMAGGDTAIRVRRLDATEPAHRGRLRLETGAALTTAALAPVIVAAGLLLVTSLITCP